jgi:hypothetical protein
VTCLAQALRDAHKDPDIAVMSMNLFSDDGDSIEKVRAQFGMQELLFDVVVFEKGEVVATGGELLCFVRKGLWIVESELARNSRQALYDFNKLVLGNATNKLFVGPQVSRSERSGVAPFPWTPNLLSRRCSPCPDPTPPTPLSFGGR